MHVLERCALPGCDAPPRFARVDARYCSDTHRLKDWRRKKRAARVTAPRLPIQQPHDAEHADVDPGDMPEPEDPEGIASEYQQLLARAREIVHLEGLLIINPRDEEARARIRQLRSRPEDP